MRKARVSLLVFLSLAGCAAMDGGLLSSFRRQSEPRDDGPSNSSRASNFAGTDQKAAAPKLGADIQPVAATNCATKPVGEIAESIGAIARPP